MDLGVEAARLITAITRHGINRVDSANVWRY